MNEIARICDSGMLDDFYETQLLREVNKLSNYPPMSQEAEILKTYLDTVISIPWDRKTKLTDNLEESETILKNEHYGLEKIKERITETISVQLMTGKIDERKFHKRTDKYFKFTAFRKT